MLSSARPDWETPQWLFDRCDKIFHFQLDTAASAANKKCKRFFDKTHSAFQQPWTPGPVWLNPPYGDHGIARFVGHAKIEAETSGATVVCLVPARTDTNWFAIIWEHARLIIFLHGRLKSSAPLVQAVPRALAIFSPDPVLTRYPDLLDAVADLGHAVNPQTLRAGRSPPLEQGFRRQQITSAAELLCSRIVTRRTGRGCTKRSHCSTILSRKAMRPSLSGRIATTY
jgi:site-specific DNA-methyltransferase (adenine-specific)